jgi:hypothetical protein
LNDKDSFERRFEMNKLKLLIVFLLITILHSAAFADVLIDTGTPTNTSLQWSFHGNPTSEVWHAGLFSLDQSYFLTDINLYLTPYYDGIVTVSIYPGDVVPVVGSELLSDTFLGTTGGPTGWYGISELNWEVSSGSYWVAFEAREKDYYYSTLPSAAPSPMDAYACYNPSLGGWNLTGNVGIGMRISGEVVPLPISVTVDIDIKPGSYPNSINPNAGGVIPVAILTTDTFDASTVNPETVALEGAGARGEGKSGRYGSIEDVDGDGDLDLVIQVVNDINWTPDATESTLTGETFDGIPIEGTDSVNIVPPE